MSEDHSFYAVYLNIDGKRCVVVGGGRVALRKIERLLQDGGAVLVISPELTSGIQALADTGRIMHRRRTYQPGDLDGAYIAFAATDSPEVNRQVWQDAMLRNVLVNVADNSAMCSFIVPAVFEAGPLRIAVSTSAADPGAAKRIRDALAETLQAGDNPLACAVNDWHPNRRGNTSANAVDGAENG